MDLRHWLMIMSRLDYCKFIRLQFTVDTWSCARRCGHADVLVIHLLGRPRHLSDSGSTAMAASVEFKLCTLIMLDRSTIPRRTVRSL